MENTPPAAIRGFRAHTALHHRAPIGFRKLHIHANAAQPIRRHLPMRANQREIRRVDDDNLLAIIATRLQRGARTIQAARWRVKLRKVLNTIGRTAGKQAAAFLPDAAIIAER